MVGVVMRVFAAALLALAIIAAQLVYGGTMRTVFGLPCYALAALAGVLGAAVLFWKRAVPPKPVPVTAAVLACLYLLWRSLNSTGQDLSLFYTFLVTACLAVYCLFACMVTTPASRYVFVCILLVAAIGQIIVAAIQFSEPGYYWPLPWISEQMRVWYLKPGGGSVRGHGIFLNGNHLAWFLNGMAFLSLGLACLGRSAIWVKIVFAYLGAVCVAGTVLTLSRGGTLGLGAGLVTFFVLSVVALGLGARDRRLVILMVMMGVLAVGLGGGYWLFSRSSAAQARMSMIGDDIYRTSLWPAAVRQSQLEPLLGTGAGSFTQLSRRLRDYMSEADDTYAHNDWAQTLSDFGFVGLVLVTAAFLLNFSAGFQGYIEALRQRMAIASRPQSNSAAFGIGALSALVAFATHSFFDFNMQLPANALFAAACAGMLANSGVAPQGNSGKRRIARWMTGIFSALAGLYLFFLLIQNVGPEWQALQAENALLAGDGVLAASEAEKGLKSSPRHSRLHRLLGQALIESAPLSADPRENYVLAAYHLRRSIERDPDERWNQLMLGIALSKLRLKPAAEHAYLEAIRLDPGNPVVHEYHALFLENSGKIPEAIRAYEVSAVVPGTKFTFPRLQALRELEKKSRSLH